ncbi:MAG TPA: hypothetical protein VHA35_14300 [Dongiaceae bacterium]|jgi:hypothetical protein|nr:hypothetical protein [Dongiaceae bacterium]
MQRRRWLAIGAVLSILLAPGAAAADSACDAAAVGDLLDRIAAALGTPKAQAAMKAARDDFDQDQKFDDDENVKYLAAAAIYIKAKDDLDAGAVDDACALLQNAGKLIRAVIAGQ